MLIGYARTSTADQVAGLEAQLRDLADAGCKQVYREKISSVAVDRPQLDACLDYLRPGDVLVVTRLDRLAGRSGTCWRSSPTWSAAASACASSRSASTPRRRAAG